MLLTCGDEHDSIARPGGRRGRVLSAWWPYRGRSAAKPPCCIPGTPAVAVPAQPGRADVDPLLTGSLRRLVVAGTDADLAAVLVRLLRRDRLDVELAYLPADRRSAAARIWGLPHGAAALELAREGAGRPGRGPRPGRADARRGLLRRGARTAGGDAAADRDALAGRRPVARRDRQAHASRGRRPREPVGCSSRR